MNDRLKNLGVSKQYFESSKNYDFVKNNKWKVPYILKYLNRKVLDVGSGDGRVLKLLPDAVGIDSHDFAITDRVTSQSITETNFKGDYFDAIIIMHVLEHLGHEDLFLAMAEMNRILKPGGEVFVVIPAPLNMNYFDDYTHRKGFSKSGLKSLFKDFGFDLIEINYSLSKRWYVPSFLVPFFELCYPFVLTEIYGVFKKK